MVTGFLNIHYARGFLYSAAGFLLRVLGPTLLCHFFCHSFSLS